MLGGHCSSELSSAGDREPPMAWGAAENELRQQAFWVRGPGAVTSVTPLYSSCANAAKHCGRVPVIQNQAAGEPTACPELAAPGPGGGAHRHVGRRRGGCGYHAPTFAVRNSSERDTEKVECSSVSEALAVG